MMLVLIEQRSWNLALNLDNRVQFVLSSQKTNNPASFYSK